MIAYVARRLALLVPTLLGVSVIAFLIVHWMPGDPAEILAGEHASPTVVQELREELGLDRPLAEQYARWISGILRGDLGRSAKTHERVGAEIRRYFPATVELASAALLLAFVAAGSGFALTDGLPPVEAEALARLESSPRHGEWIEASAARRQ